MIQWGNNSALAGFQNALALGADIGGAIKQSRENSALAAYVETPGKESLADLARVNPRLGMQAQSQMQQQQQALAKAEQERVANDLRVKAARGDSAALQQLVGIDFDGWKTLDASQKKMMADQTAYTGQAALRISQLPPEQQPVAWDQAIEQGVQAGYTGLADYRGKFSPEALKGAIDNAGLVEKFISLAEPKYMAVPNEAGLVNVRDPNAIRQFQAERTTQVAAPASKADYDALPPGAEYRAPDGSIKRKGGGGSNATGSFPASRIGG